MKSNYWLRRDAIFHREVKIAEADIAKELRRVEAKTASDMKSLYSFITSGNENILPSDLFRYNSYFLLLEDLQNNLLTMGNREIRTIEKSMRDLYITNTQLISDELSFNIPIDERKIVNAIKSQWLGDGKIYSDRVWGNTTVLSERVQQCLTDALIRGDSVDVLATQLENEFAVSYRNAQRLVRTELSYIQNQSALDGYQEAGYEYYMFKAIGDDRCCDECMELDGNIYRIDEATPGENISPIHPNDRCGILAVSEDAVKTEV